MILKELGREWQWPDADRECRAVVFDWSADLNATYEALDHCERDNAEAVEGPCYRSCVQAGGNMGVWPWLLSKNFLNVYTFEPDPICFKYLCRNVPEHHVHKFQAALGNKRGQVALDYVDYNLGAQYIATQRPGTIPVLRIDDLSLTDCDLIYLDIEGFELNALYGGYNTIKNCLPVIVVEDKGLSDKYGSPQGQIERWLWHEFKYEVHRRVHRDVILVPPK